MSINPSSPLLFSDSILQPNSIPADFTQATIPRDAIATIPKYSEEMYSKFSNEAKERVRLWLNHSNQKVQPVIFDQQKLESILKPGDLFLKYYPNNPSSKPSVYLIQKAQKMIKPLSTDDHYFTHASLYIGAGQIAHAMNEGVRQHDLNDPKIALLPNTPGGYLIIRPKNQQLATQVSHIARTLSAQKEQKSVYQYSNVKAASSVLTHSGLGKNALKRYLLASAFSHCGVRPLDHGKPQSFYCSEFVIWCLQAAESLQAIERVNAKLSLFNKIIFPNVSGLSEIEQVKILEKWATEVVAEHADNLKAEIMVNLDSAYTTPQKLHEFILTSKLFDKVMFITSPNESELITIADKSQNA